MPDFKEVKEILEFYKKEEPNTYDKYMNIYEKEYPDIYKKLKRELEKPGIKKPPKKIIIMALLAVAISLGIYLVISILISQIGGNTAPSIDSFLIPETLTLNSSIIPKITVSDKEKNIGSVSLKYVSPSSKEQECTAEKKGDLWEGCAVSLNEGGTWKIYVYAKDVYETASASFDVYVPVSKTCETSLNCGNQTCKNKILINYSCTESICYSKKSIVNCCENTDCISGKSCNKTIYNCFSKPACGNSICEEPENCGSCTKDCLTQGKVCCNNLTYVGNCCSDENCETGFSCTDNVCQITTHGEVIKTVLSDVFKAKNATAKYGTKSVKLWSDPIEVWTFDSSAECTNGSNIRAVFQAVSSLYRINKLGNLTSDEKKDITYWILSRYNNSEFRDCSSSLYKNEIKTLYAVKTLKYLNSLDLASKFNIISNLYDKYTRTSITELQKLCDYWNDNSVLKEDYSRSISIYLQVLGMFNEAPSTQEKSDMIKALNCSQNADGTWLDTEHLYWTVEALSALNSLNIINKTKTINWIKSRQFSDGHFGKSASLTSLNGNWYAVKSLEILNETNSINKTLAFDFVTSRLLRDWASFKEKYKLSDSNIDKTDEDLKLRWFTVDSYFLLKQAVAE